MQTSFEHIRFQRHNGGWLIFDQNDPEAMVECPADEKSVEAAINELRDRRRRGGKKVN